MKRERGFSPIDEAAKQRIAALAALPDSDIDTSDIPEWTEEDFARAVPFHSLYKPRKEMNELLRKDMLEERQNLV